MRARTVTLGTSSKLFSLTGWRVGWCFPPPPPALQPPTTHVTHSGRALSGNEELLAACRSVHAYATFCAPVPLQLGIAAALHREVDVACGGNCDVAPASDDSGSHIAYTSHLLAANARALSDALEEQQLRVCAASGGYFIIADVSATQLPDDSFCRSAPPRSTRPLPLNSATWRLTPRRRQLVKHARVGALPLSLFYSDASNPPPKHLVRFSVCKVSTAPQPPHAALALIE